MRTLVNANVLFEVAPAQHGLGRKPKICTPSAMAKGTDIEGPLENVNGNTLVLWG